MQQLASLPVPFPVFTIRNQVGFFLSALFFPLLFFPFTREGDDDVDGAWVFGRSLEGWTRSNPTLDARWEEGCCPNYRSICN